MKDTNEYSLQYVDEEIEEELRRWHESELAEQQPPALEEYPENLIKRSARKPFRIPDFDPPRDKEMAVFTHAKKLSEYIFVITEKSPKNYGGALYPVSKTLPSIWWNTFTALISNAIKCANRFKKARWLTCV